MVIPRSSAAGALLGWKAIASRASVAEAPYEEPPWNPSVAQTAGVSIRRRTIRVNPLGSFRITGASGCRDHKTWPRRVVSRKTASAGTSTTGADGLGGGSEGREALADVPSGVRRTTCARALVRYRPATRAMVASSIDAASADSCAALGQRPVVATRQALLTDLSSQAPWPRSLRTSRFRFAT